MNKEEGRKITHEEVECEVCNKTGKLMENMMRHIRNTQVGSQCEEDSVTLELVEEIENHMREKQVKFRCEQCKYGVGNKDVVREDRLNKQEKIGVEDKEDIKEQGSENELLNKKKGGQEKNEGKQGGIRKKIKTRNSQQ